MSDPRLNALYYRLWDMLSNTAKATPKAGEAQSAYGVNTLHAVDLLIDLVDDDLLAARTAASSMQ